MENIIDKENKIEKEPKVVALYIDDDESMVNLIKKALKRDDIVTVVCNSVEEALDAISKYNPPILFLDNKLSVGDEGVEVLKKISDKQVEVYSLSSKPDAFKQFGEMVKGSVKKNDYKEIEKIVNKYTEDHKN